MIQKISFSKFGKFQNREFELAPITLVYGLNEAGKTTFFDGLFHSVCKPSETKKAGKMLKSRYGAGRIASVLFTNKNGDLNISEDAFLNLYAIRAGDLKLEWSQGSDWMEKLKSKVFHGGLDPKLFIAEFDKRSSDNKNFVHNRELDAARQKRENTKTILEKLKGDRQLLLNKEKSLADLEKSLKHAHTERLEREQQIISFEKALALEDRVLQRQKLVSQISKCVAFEKLRAELYSLSPWRNLKREDFEQQHRALNLIQEELKAVLVKKEFQCELISKAKNESENLKHNLEHAASKMVIAHRISEQIENAILQKSQSHRPLWIAASIILILFSLGIFAASYQQGVIGYSVLGLTLFLSAVAFIVGWRIKTFLQIGKWVSELIRWKKEWESISLSQLVNSDSLENFLLLLKKVQSEKEVLERQAFESHERLLLLNASLSEMEVEIARLENIQKLKATEEKKWLENLGIRNGEDFLIQFSKIGELEIQYKQVILNLKTSYPDLKIAPEEVLSDDSKLNLQIDLAELIRDANRKLNVLDEEGIPSVGRDDASLQRLKREYQDCKIEKEMWAQKERAEIAETGVLTGAVGVSLGKLAEEIVNAEDAIAILHTEVKTKEIEKKASLLALNIFKKLGDDRQVLWKTLTKEIQCLLAPILVMERLIHLDGLSTEHMRFQDAGGEVRSLDHLSTGTQDLFVLAARLALAESTRSEPCILVLDEPFLALDYQRELGAIEMLKSFHNRTGWQIILLTKELRLAKNLTQVFPALVQINLSPT